MSDYGGLSIRAYGHPIPNEQLGFLNGLTPQALVRNTFSYLTYASMGAITTVYCIIEDLL